MPGHPQQVRWLFTLFILILMTVMFVAFATRRNRAASLSRRQTELARQKAEAEKVERNRAALPRAEYVMSEPQTLALRQIRQARDQRYRAIMPFESMGENTTEVSIGSHDLLDMPGLPAAQSDLVVVGTITDAKGYVTENKSAAYSEYSVDITEVFKGGAALTGRRVTAERVGATVVLPNGQTLLVWDAYRGTPETGHRYALFLKYSFEGEDYLIVTAYRLQDSRVFSVDRLPQCEFFDGNEESSFLDLMRSSAR
jgi:hypothetical protein